MKQLTIKEVAPYLPYGVKALVWDSRFGIGDTFLDKITGVYEDLVTFNDSPDWYFDSDENDTEIKLALRPLSDLDNYLRNEFEKLDKGYVYNKIAVDLFCEENGVSELIEHTEINSLPYECVEYMFEHHYDVFGLIEKGLAIDINTLK